MKNKTFRYLLIAGLTILSNLAFAQLPAIDSVKLIPANPASNDLLKVVCYTTFTHGGCSINSVQTEQIGNDIFLNLDYSVGMATYICHSVDTFDLDNPGAGTYQLTINLATNQQDIIEDTHILQFQIDPYLGIDEFRSNSFTFYPNPVQHELRFKANFTVEKIEIRSVSGQLIHSTELLPGNPTIDVSALKQGIYLMTLVDPSGNTFTQRISKNTN
ncbi:MAG: T9SS type A sorting domain-containing protein [Fluviicola sp.]